MKIHIKEDTRNTKKRNTRVALVNPKKKTKLGNHVGYRLLLGVDNYPAAFTNYNVWITPYNKSEK